MTTTLSQVIHCLLIYDVIRKLVETFTERDVEILLLLLKSESVITDTVAEKMFVCMCVLSQSQSIQVLEWRSEEMILPH